MARLSREFVKLETRILNDHRFFTLSEFEQLTFIKLLGISRTTQNKIPKNLSVIRELLRTNRGETEIKSALKRIKQNFPKFKENKYFYYFEEYELRMNNSVPKGENNYCIDEDEDKDEDKDEDEDKEIEQLTALFNSALYIPKLLEKEFIKELYDKFGYDKSKIIIRKFAAGKFHKVDTMRDSLNSDGTIKPKNQKQEGIVIEHRPA